MYELRKHHGTCKEVRKVLQTEPDKVPEEIKQNVARYSRGTECKYCGRSICSKYQLRRHHAVCNSALELFKTDPDKLSEEVKRDIVHFGSIICKEKVDRKRKKMKDDSDAPMEKKMKSDAVYICGKCLRRCLTPEALKNHMVHSHDIITEEEPQPNQWFEPDQENGVSPP